jgi:transcription elongation factor GreA
MEGKVFYITKEKLGELKQEHEKLAAFEHAKTAGHEAPKIFESEDLNPEFVAYQEDMEALRSRIEELNTIFEHHEIIKNPPKEKQMFVDIGAKVKIDMNGEKDEFVIVGTVEANPELGKISNESPVGKALLGRKVGDEILISSPKKILYKIKEITYEIN